MFGYDAFLALSASCAKRLRLSGFMREDLTGPNAA
jgi:hypothetical protein